ncbi:protein commissureless 2 homolog [Armigeres subalbatus]|uniref:protein commissureless 2 homolog n=1 Tax=Armigeres subalbatus TaxID=124917 RepID=UPI002ED4D377
MLDAMESRITFEVPSSLDFDKLIRDNNYTLFWQNLHSEPSRDRDSSALSPVDPSVQGDRNSSDFSLMSSLQHFAGARGGADGWGLSFGDGINQIEEPLVDPSLLWIGAVMVLLILSGLFCVCSCYLYYKYRRWQKCVSSATCQSLTRMDIEAPPPYDIETLPSYTIASGLPSYEDAVRHIVRQQQQSRAGYQPATAAVQKPMSTGSSTASIHPQSVVKFFESRPENWLNVTIFEEIHYNFIGRGTSAAGPAVTEGHTKADEAASDCTLVDDSKGTKDDDDGSGSGLFRVQICMVNENNKIQSCNR